LRGQRWNYSDYYYGIFLDSLFSAGLSHGADSAVPIELQDNQAVIQVKGVVCSFCAYGTEKNLSKLNFLDKSQYEGDGVLLDIHTHRITLALDGSQTVDYVAINTAIVKGGYDPVIYYTRLHGKVREVNGQYLLTCSNNGQVYVLQGQDLARLTQLPAAYVEGQISVDSLVGLSMGQPVPLLVSQTEESK
jgi:hypothetical protein